MKHIVFFHLYNDYSGSPKVLKDIVSGLAKRGFHVDLVTSKGGVLDELNGCMVKKIHYNYHFSNLSIVTIFRYIWVQIMTFFIALKYTFSKNTIFYINTILPFGPALAGYITRKRIIYHYHENANTKGFVYGILALIMQHIASDIICVSKYQSSFLKRTNNIYIVPNALPISFIRRLRPNISKAFERKRILMLSSLKTYKGITDLFKLAELLPNMCFSLIINDTQKNINKFLNEHNVRTKPNVTIYHRQKNVLTFYNESSLLINLSNKKMFIETFGLTALEGMACALPVIVPSEGGIAELVTDGYNGFKIDVQDIQNIAKKIAEIFSDRSLYFTLANNAKTYSTFFHIENTIKAINNIIEN